MTALLTSCRRSAAIRIAAVASLFPSLAFLPTSLQANPENGVVVAGMAEIGEGLNGHLAITHPLPLPTESAGAPLPPFLETVFFSETGGSTAFTLTIRRHRCGW